MREAIIRHHRNWDGKTKGLLFFEMRENTGYSIGEPQRLDAFHIEEMPSKLLRRTTYEIKVSRSDFLSEIRNPVKRRFGLRVSNHFYFVTRPGIAKVEEIPQECGLVEIYGPGADEPSWKVIVPAPWRDTPPPTWAFVASLARALGRLNDMEPK